MTCTHALLNRSPLKQPTYLVTSGDSPPAPFLSMAEIENSDNSQGQGATFTFIHQKLQILHLQGADNEGGGTSWLNGS